MAWIESVERNNSGQVWLEFEELGIADWATLQATEPCPSDILGEGRLVTGTFEHSSGEVLNLFIAGEANPIGSTANHPFWSEDRQDFVQAGSLNPGEHLRFADGPTTTLERTEPIAEQLPVYNLEVDGEHVYYVGESGVLVHNSCVTWSTSRKGAFDWDHIFSEDHLRKGIMNLGHDTSHIMESISDAVHQASRKGLLRAGPNQIETAINGQKVLSVPSSTRRGIWSTLTHGLGSRHENSAT